jgi:hypothetical protein
VFIEDDDKLMAAFIMLKEVMLKENSSFDHNVCIHPFIMDKLIMGENI